MAPYGVNNKAFELFLNTKKLNESLPAYISSQQQIKRSQLRLSLTSNHLANSEKYRSDDVNYSF